MQKRTNSEPRLLTRAEVARIFQVSPNTVTRWAEAGKLPVVKTLGGHRRYAAEAVMELARQTKAGFANFIEENVHMEKTVIDVPAMFGDHHVLEVRRILSELSGVEEINASSCFKAVELTFDPTKISVEKITARLRDAGYLDPLSVPVEAGTVVFKETNGDKKYFRHTTAYEQTNRVVSFAQDVPQGQPVLWPCPGVGVLKEMDN